MRGLPRRWLHPQAVPRGFLRLYILTLLARGPETGYSIMGKIDERTDGAWRPGPGTMYPLLKGLVSDGLAKVASGRVGSKSYSITPRGERELHAMRGNLGSMGRKERVLARLFSDLVPAETFVPLMINRYREGIELFKEKISEVPLPERDVHLRDIKLFMEAQVEWADRQLASKGGTKPLRKRGRHRAGGAEV